MGQQASVASNHLEEKKGRVHNGYSSQLDGLRAWHFGTTPRQGRRSGLSRRSNGPWQISASTPLFQHLSIYSRRTTSGRQRRETTNDYQ